MNDVVNTTNATNVQFGQVESNTFDANFAEQGSSLRLKGGHIYLVQITSQFGSSGQRRAFTVRDPGDFNNYIQFGQSLSPIINDTSATLFAVVDMTATLWGNTFHNCYFSNISSAGSVRSVGILVYLIQ
jgi:hypothetical protein